VSKNVIVVGGGLAGLAASIFLARGGRTVTIFEKRRYLGGRAITHLRHGYRFNLGPHAFYRRGLGSQVLRELGIPVRGGRPDGRGIALLADREYGFPGRPLSILTTGLLSVGEKMETVLLLLRIRQTKKFDRYRNVSVREWLDQNVKRERVRETIEALIRLATYCNEPEKQSAAAALAQLRLGMRGGVIYVDEGWQKLVDALHSSAVAAGVNFVTSSRVVSIVHDGQVRGIELGGLEEEVVEKSTMTAVALPDLSKLEEQGTRLPAETVVLAVDPSTARELMKGDVDWPEMSPVKASCLDVALSKLPNPKRKFALGIDVPLYLSVHSAWAQLTPKGGALIHTARYGGGDQAELEKLLDRVQPGWREVVVHRRFLPAMVVSNALLPPSRGDAPVRPQPVTSVRGLYLAGDWVGEEGLLSDASLASARAAAKAILATSA
jgi:phytoene dehydrogenase-like protein